MLTIEDALYRFKNMYRVSPWWLKRTAGWVYSKFPMDIRYGKVYQEYEEFLRDSQWWTQTELEEWQLEQLNKLLKHAYENVPYYKHIYDERGLKPDDIKDFNDLRKLPYLTRYIVKNNFEKLIAQNYPKSKRLYFTTGGTSGTPLGFYWEKGRTRSLERAFMWRQWNWAGYNLGDKTVVLRGSVIKDLIADYDPIDNTLFLSSYNLREETLASYIEKIQAFQPKSIQAYPSVISLFANYVLRHNIPPIQSLKVILCGSENLFPPQRELLEQAFQCRVFSWYGQGECVSLAGNCEHSNNYHVFSEYSITELIDANDNPVYEEGGMGEIVATGFNNYVMPFIRYKTGDVGVRTTAPCSCGRNYPLLKRIEGRTQEYIITKDDRIVSLTGLIFGLHFTAFTKIRKMQLIQEHKGIVTVKIVKEVGYSSEDEQEIKSKMQNAVDGSLEITFCYVDDIAPTPRGKHKFLIQKLPIQFGSTTINAT